MQATEGFDALIGANRGCFAAFAAVYDCAGAGDRRGATASASAAASAWSATPTSSWPATTPTSACPRSTAARSARRPTWPDWCRSTRCGRWSTRRPPPPPPSCTPSARCSRWSPRDELRDAAFEVAGRDRGEVADGDPRGQGEPQRHRPVGRQALATGSSRASRSSSTCPASPTSCATRSSTSATPTRTEHEHEYRQADDRGGRRRRAARRHDHRHRRVGLAAQADEHRAGDPALRR